MHLDLPTIALLAGVAIVAVLLGRASARRRDPDLVSAQLAAVEAIEAGGFPAAGTPSPPPPASSGDLAAQAGSLKARGRTIQAIKVVREQTGMSLKDAKDFVDRL